MLENATWSLSQMIFTKCKPERCHLAFAGRCPGMLGLLPSGQWQVCIGRPLPRLQTLH